MSDNNEKQNNGLKIENEKTDTEDIRQQNEGDTVSEKKTVRLFGHKITRKKIYTACAGAVCAALLVGSYAMVNSDSVTPDTDSAAKVTEIQTKVKTDKKEEKVQVTDSDADTKESVKKTETAQETVKKKREETESQEKVASNNKSNTNSSVSENANKSDKGTLGNVVVNDVRTINLGNTGETVQTFTIPAPGTYIVFGSLCSFGTGSKSGLLGFEFNGSAGMDVYNQCGSYEDSTNSFRGLQHSSPVVVHTANASIRYRIYNTSTGSYTLRFIALRIK